MPDCVIENFEQRKENEEFPESTIYVLENLNYKPEEFAYVEKEKPKVEEKKAEEDKKPEEEVKAPAGKGPAGKAPAAKDKKKAEEEAKKKAEEEAALKRLEES